MDLLVMNYSISMYKFFKINFVKVYLLGIELGWHLFFSTLTLLSHCLLAYIVSNKKSSVLLIFISPLVMCLFHLLILRVSVYQWIWCYDLPWCIFLHVSCTGTVLKVLDLQAHNLHQILPPFFHSFSYHGLQFNLY